MRVRVTFVGIRSASSFRGDEESARAAIDVLGHRAYCGYSDYGLRIRRRRLIVLRVPCVCVHVRCVFAVLPKYAVSAFARLYRAIQRFLTKHTHIYIHTSASLSGRTIVQTPSEYTSVRHRRKETRAREFTPGRSCPFYALGVGRRFLKRTTTNATTDTAPDHVDRPLPGDAPSSTSPLTVVFRETRCPSNKRTAAERSTAYCTFRIIYYIIFVYISSGLRSRCRRKTRDDQDVTAGESFATIKRSIKYLCAYR